MHLVIPLKSHTPSVSVTFSTLISRLHLLNLMPITYLSGVKTGKYLPKLQNWLETKVYSKDFKL